MPDIPRGTRIAHIGIAVRGLDELVHLYRDVLELTGVRVVRNGTTLLDTVTWSVDEGQRWVVLGPEQ